MGVPLKKDLKTVKWPMVSDQHCLCSQWAPVQPLLQQDKGTLIGNMQGILCYLPLKLAEISSSESWCEDGYFVKIRGKALGEQIEVSPGVIPALFAFSAPCKRTWTFCTALVKSPSCLHVAAGHEPWGSLAAAHSFLSACHTFLQTQISDTEVFTY